MDRTLLQNPFRNDIVASPDQALLEQPDVLEIHRQPFDLCCQTYDAVAREHISSSVLLHGEAGCGKTHLLSRFRRWLTGEGDSRPDLSPAAFVPIRMETATSQIWRHIRRRLTEEMTRRGSDGTCPLDRILHRLGALHGGSLPGALEAAAAKDLGLDLENILERFEQGQHRRLCRAWLAGDGLSDADLQLLNLSSARLDEIEEDFAESNARRVVLAIVRLSAPLPVVFCFDQVEALGISQYGVRSFGPFNRMGAALVDETTNVLIVSTILTAFLRDLQGQNMRSDYQRIGKQLMDLQPLDFAQGRKLIDSRLALVHELKEEDPIPVAALGSVYEQHHGRCNARRLIHEARRLFAEWQKCALPNASSIPDFLQTQMESLWADADVRRHPEQADAVLAHGLPAVLELLGYKTTSTHAGLTIDRGDTGRVETGIDVVFVNQANMRSLAATLKRLLDKHASAAPLRLVRDQRLPISPSASVTRQRLRKIEERGGRLVRVEAEALAALHAVRQLLTAATSGDLSPNGEAVEAKTVREWLAQNLPREVRNLAADLLDAETQQTENRSPDALLELIARRKVAPVDELAALTHWSKEEIEDYARTHPLHVRWFGGPCPVVCQAVAPDAAKENGYAR